MAKREVVSVKEGQYNGPGIFLVIAKDEYGTTVTTTDRDGTKYTWHFGTDAVFTHISAGVENSKVFKDRTLCTTIELCVSIAEATDTAAGYEIAEQIRQLIR